MLGRVEGKAAGAVGVLTKRVPNTTRRGTARARAEETLFNLTPSKSQHKASSPVKALEEEGYSGSLIPSENRARRNDLDLLPIA